MRDESRGRVRPCLTTTRNSPPRTASGAFRATRRQVTAPKIGNVYARSTVLRHTPPALGPTSNLTTALGSVESSIPLLAALPMHSDAGRIANHTGHSPDR